MQVTDPRAIKALAHPLRLDLLELLGAKGAATAAECGRILGVPQANCSFHLRQLAKYGYVEDAGPGEDRRERTWRIAASKPTIKLDSRGNHLVRRHLERVVVDREVDAIRSYMERESDESRAWAQSLGMASAMLSLTAEEVADIKDGWKALLEPYLNRAGAQAEGRRHVRFFFAATPLGDDQ